MTLKIIVISTLIVDICHAGLLDGPYDNSIKDGVVFIPVGAGIFLLFTFLCKVESTALRVLSLGFWVLFWMAALFGITCSAVESCNLNSKSVDLLRWLCFFSLPIWWIFMMVESRFSEERRIINNLDDVRFLDRHLETLTQARPIVRWHVEFFRYVFLRDKFGRSRRQAMRIRSEDKVSLFSINVVSWCVLDTPLINKYDGREVHLLRIPCPSGTVFTSSQLTFPCTLLPKRVIIITGGSQGRCTPLT